MKMFFTEKVHEIETFAPKTCEKLIKILCAVEEIDQKTLDQIEKNMQNYKPDNSHKTADIVDAILKGSSHAIRLQVQELLNTDNVNQSKQI